MIEWIIKRDGSEEPFSPEKLNGWAKWAAEHLGGFVDWAGVAMRAVASLPEKASSQELQLALIQECKSQQTWAYYRMAARLYIPYIRKQMYGGDGTVPPIQKIHQELQQWGLMRTLDYTDAEYDQIEQMLEHKRDFNYAEFQIKQIIEKYSLCDRRVKSDSPILGKYFESPQHVYMRMAMALAEDESRDVRMHHVAKWYSHLSCNRLNAPTPNFANLGTTHNGLASCCLVMADDREISLGIHDYIARAMTVASAGIGTTILCRSIGDPVRGGSIVHMGKLGYYRALAGEVNSSIQNGRGGACTTYFSCYDPEVMTLMNLRHPKSPEDKRILTMDFAVCVNKHLYRKAAANEDIFFFNAYTAPDLVRAFYDSEPGLFEAIYERYEQDPTFKKEYFSARKIIIAAENIAIETGSLYQFYADEANRHTPFYDPIYSSNLCNEVFEPTAPYFALPQLSMYGPVAYTTTRSELLNALTDEGDVKIGKVFAHSHASPERIELLTGPRHAKAAQELRVGDRWVNIDGEWEVTEIVQRVVEPEVALCSLAAIVPSYIESEEQYADVAYYALKMIDKCIHLSDFPLPHIAYTARQRLSAGVGLTGVAHYMARRRKRYTTIDGKQELHRLAERHAYHLIRASLRLGQELGNAPWIHRTKWPEGWLPLDTYCKKVDEIAPFELQYDWETLRQEIIDNGGIRNSTLIAHMPTESSSKASGVPNGLYPIRDFALGKSDNGKLIDWAPTDGDRLKRYYDIAWDVPMQDQIDLYAINQKWTDQGISGDNWIRLEGDSTVWTEDLVKHSMYKARMGIKGRYYYNSKTSKTIVNESTGEETIVVVTTEHNTADKCTSGGCDA
jgi:ribonucleoside-diphosphate reductase alpha chain